ncbi:gypsy retrotransposon integrase-like protein 1, partial [Plakobranchus ocellatus]
TPFLSGEVKVLCIPDAICDVIVGNMEGARSPEDPDMSVMQEDPRILALVDAGRTSRRGGKVVSFEKARGIVYRRYEHLGRNVDVKQVVLPMPLREYVMSVAHDSITGAHLGIRRTKDKILSNFYWPGVDGDVTRYCRSCDVCQRTVNKGTVPRVPLEKVPLIDTPFKRVAIDLVGPINPPSEAGHRFILTLVDYATRFAEAVPLRKIDTESVAEALVDIYSRLSVPEEVLSDHGTQFISDCMKEVCRLLGIKQKTTTPYHPMCNGLVERFNATLKTCLHLEGEHSNDSDCEALPELGEWGSEETVNDLKYGDGLTLDQRKQLEEVAVTYSSIFSDRPGLYRSKELNVLHQRYYQPFISGVRDNDDDDDDDDYGNGGVCKRRPLALKAWEHAVQSKDFITDQILIKEDDFQSQPLTAQRQLKPDAVPSIFSFSFEEKKRRRTSYEIGANVSIHEAAGPSHKEIDAQTSVTRKDINKLEYQVKDLETENRDCEKS